MEEVIMTINGKRSFSYNGVKYYVQDLAGADRTDDNKYYVCIVKDGWYNIAYNKLNWRMDKFKTIKEAQRYVRDFDFLLDTL